MEREGKCERLMEEEGRDRMRKVEGETLGHPVRIRPRGTRMQDRYLSTASQPSSPTSPLLTRSWRCLRQRPPLVQKISPACKSSTESPEEDAALGKTIIFLPPQSPLSRESKLQKNISLEASRLAAGARASY